MYLIEQKANELVEKFTGLEDDRMLHEGRFLDEHLAKKCAIICVDEMLQVLGKLKKPEYTTFIEWEQLKTQEEADTMDGYEYINLLEQVKERLLAKQK